MLPEEWEAVKAVVEAAMEESETALIPPLVGMDVLEKAYAVMVGEPTE
jgi:hypothetical protein